MSQCMITVKYYVLRPLVIVIFLLLFINYDRNMSKHLVKSHKFVYNHSKSTDVYNRNNITTGRNNHLSVKSNGTSSALSENRISQSKTSFADNTCKISTPGAIRCWDIKFPIVFIHVGKNGGQSFDQTIPQIVRKMHGRYIGFQHFDWSAIHERNTKYIAILLRNPVSRMISHFFFSKTLKWSPNSPIRSITLSDYLRNYQLMLDTNQFWQDGSAAIMWLTGTHTATYVGIRPRQVHKRELKLLNYTKICKLAVKRLEETWWFGFIEDQKRSFELLRYQMDYTKTIRFPHRHKTGGVKPKVSEDDLKIIESLMPLDMWFYRYAQKMFEARWNQYQTGIYVKPEMPPIPEPSCVSTRYAIKCIKGPLKSLYFKGRAPRNHTYII